MKTNTYTDSQLLTFYLDGELDKQTADTLLKRVESNPELQSQMQTEMAIKNATSGQMIEPTLDMKNDLFNKLGFNNNSKPIPVAFWTIPIVKKSIWSFATALGILGIFFIANNYNNDIASIEKSNVIPTVKSTEIIEDITVSENDITTYGISSNDISSNDISSHDITTNDISDDIEVIEITNNLDGNYIETVENETMESSLVENYSIETAVNSNTINANNFISINYVNEEIVPKNLSNQLMPNNSYSIHTPMRELINLSNIGSYIFSSNDYSSNNEFLDDKISIKGLNLNQSNPLLSGGVFLNYNRVWKYGFNIGLEVGYEDIQKRTLTDVTTQTNISFTGVLKYDFNKANILNINPFVQVQAGFGSAINNFMYATSIGCEYCPTYSQFGLQLSYDWRFFEYSYGGGGDLLKHTVFKKDGPSFSIIYKF